MTDRVQVLKRESTAGGGDPADEAPWDAPIEPQEDAIEAAGLYVQDVSNRDETTLIARSGNDMTFKDVNNATPVTLSNLVQPKSNLAAVTDPTANDDSGDGYSVGSRWINVTLDKEFVCLDATATAAVWTQTTSAGATDTDAIHDNVAGEIHAISSKGTPVDADVLIIEDSEDSWAKKSILLADLPGGGSGLEENWVYNATGVSTSTTSYQTAETLTFTPDSAGDDWMIEWSFQIDIGSSNNEWVRTRIYVDGSDSYAAKRWVLEYGYGIETYSGTIRLSALSASSHTVAVQFYPEGSWVTMNCRHIWIRARNLTTVGGGGGGADPTAIHTDGSAEISAVTEKTSPIGADLLVIEDSAASNVKKRVQISNVGKGIKLDDLAAPDDNTDLNATTGLHGLLPKLGGGTTNFLRADGTWAAPSGGGGDADAIHDNVAAEISAVTEKTTPVGADVLLIEDSAASYAKKRVQITNLPGGSGTDPNAIHDNVAAEISAVTAKATPTGSDLLLIEDAADSNAKKRITLGDLPDIFTASPAFDAYDNSGGTNVNSGAVVPLGTERAKTADFTHTAPSGEVTVVTAGTYVVMGEVTTDVSSGTARYDSRAWLELDTGSGFAMVPGTYGAMYNRQLTMGINTCAFTAVLTLASGDKLRIWAQRRTGTGTIITYANGSRLVIVSLQGPSGPAGADGEPGDPGAGSNIVVKDDGVLVGTVMGTLNFGTRLEVTNDGGGVCTIDSDIEESIEWDETGISTSTTSWQTAATLTFTPLTAGDDWIIEFSFYSMTADDDEWNRHRILVDDTDQYHYLRWIHPLADVHWGWAGTIILEGLSAAAHTVKIQGYPEGSWTTLTIGDCFLRARKT